MIAIFHVRALQVPAFPRKTLGLTEIRCCGSSTAGSSYKRSEEARATSHLGCFLGAYLGQLDAYRGLAGVW